MSETESDPFSASESEYEPTSSDESYSNSDVAGPSTRRKHPKNKRISVQKQHIEPVANIVPTEEPTVVPVTKNRKSADPTVCKRNVKKKAIAEGKMYTNWKGVQKGPRSTGSNCNCRYKCFENVDEETRKVVLQKFNKIGDRDLQNTYLGGLIQTTTIQRTRKKTNERQDRTSTDLIAQTFRDRDIAAPPSNKGKHANRPNRKSNETLKNVNMHSHSFLRREPHYSRNKSRRFYLSPDLNVKKMHQLYLELYEPESVSNPKYKPKIPYDFYYRYF